MKHLVRVVLTITTGKWAGLSQIVGVEDVSGGHAFPDKTIATLLDQRTVTVHKRRSPVSYIHYTEAPCVATAP